MMNNCIFNPKNAAFHTDFVDFFIRFSNAFPEKVYFLTDLLDFSIPENTLV
ncbi:MAG: hypothetical protein Q4E60_10725 [Bacteroidales bacterium]|nr:hypothetical protein [Bacteroidales bacterium]